MGTPAPKRTSKKRTTPLKVVARDRAADAHDLRLTGLDWVDVATRTGYADGRVAALAVTAYLQKTAIEQGPEHRREALSLELDRLDALLAAFWGAAMAGDVHAANLVLKIIGRRCTLWGFDRPDDATAAPARTVLISGTTEEYIATIEALIREQDSRGAAQ